VGFVARGMVKEPCEALRRNLGALNDHMLGAGADPRSNPPNLGRTRGRLCYIN